MNAHAHTHKAPRDNMRSLLHYDRHRRTHGMLFLSLLVITAALYLLYTLVWLSSSPPNRREHDAQDIDRAVQSEMQQMVALLRGKLAEDKRRQWKPLPIVGEVQRQRLQESDKSDDWKHRDRSEAHHSDSKQLVPQPVHAIPEEEQLFQEEREPVVP